VRQQRSGRRRHAIGQKIKELKRAIKKGKTLTEVHFED